MLLVVQRRTPDASHSPRARSTEMSPGASALLSQAFKGRSGCGADTRARRATTDPSAAAADHCGARSRWTCARPKRHVARSPVPVIGHQTSIARKGRTTREPPRAQTAKVESLNPGGPIAAHNFGSAPVEVGSGSRFSSSPCAAGQSTPSRSAPAACAPATPCYYRRVRAGAASGCGSYVRQMISRPIRARQRPLHSLHSR